MNSSSPPGVRENRMTQSPSLREQRHLPIEPMGRRAAHGIAWMVSQTVLTKVITTVGTLLLGALLLDEHFGLAGLAYTFSVIPGFISQGGLREILVHRHHQFRRWANPAFWMSMMQGLGSGLALAAIAPFAGRMLGEPMPPALLLVLAITFPLDALLIVPQANLQNQMRFRFLAVLELGKAAGQTGLSILFAKLGFGPYSLLLPRPVVAVVIAAVCWLTAPVSLRWKPQLRRWRFLYGDGALVFVSNACVNLILYTDYFVLGRFYQDMDIVGQYYFAFNLSLQTIALLTQNLGGVLFPALSKLQCDPARQVNGFLRATRLMAFLTLPACLGQAAVAEPLLRIAYGHKWDLAIPLLQILSIGMAMRTIGWPAVSLLNAQGRFAARMWLSIISLAAFIGMVVFGAWRFGAIGVATAAALHMLILEPAHLLIAIRPAGNALPTALRMLAGPTLVAVASIGPAWLVAQLMPEVAHRDWWRATAVFAISGMLYFPLVRFIAPDAWKEGQARLRSL
jgi:lipopolysaccharide exporter